MQNEHIACFDLPRRAAFDAMFGALDSITNRIGKRQKQQSASRPGVAPFEDTVNFHAEWLYDCILQNALIRCQRKCLVKLRQRLLQLS